MDILIDKPIEKATEDKLERKKFSVNLANNLNNYNYSNTMTLGLMGKWGSGKTSIINMVRESIDENKFCIVDFNPWYFSGRKQLISDFFEVLSERIGVGDNSEVVAKLGKHLSQYAKALKPFSLIPQLAPILAPLLKGIDEGSAFLSEYSDAQKLNLTEIKNNINDELKQYDKKVLVIIDEIDRLENEEIKEIFQLVRALGDFNNTIYLLSFDKEKVIEVFPNREEYLDKIINIPIYVPEVSLKAINEIFINEIETIFKDKGKINFKYWEEIFKIVFENEFYNLRELIRFLNIIRFNANNIVKEVNIIDYLVISFLQLFDEDVFNFIKNEKDTLIETKDIKIIQELIVKQGLTSKKNIGLDKLFEVLFLKDQYRSNRRINEIKYFDAYFQHNLSENSYSIKEIQSFININKDELLIKLENNKNVQLLFENLNEIYDKLTIENLYIYLEILISKVAFLEKQKTNSFIQSGQREAFIILKEMTSLLSSNNRGIENIISSLELNESFELRPLLDYFSCSIGFYESDALKEIITTKVEEYISRLNFTKEVATNFDLLKQIGIDVEDYIKNITSTEDGIINYLENLTDIVDTHVHPIYDEHGEITDIEEEDEEAIVLEDITNYISYEYIKAKIDNLTSDTHVNQKRLIRLFKSSKPYKEVYARQMAE